LGYEFAAEIDAAFDRIRSFPDAWPVFSDRTRRCVVSRFPYGILYQIRSDRILVTAIMHLKRDPKEWKHRAND
jgi:plasmid stabilization system protein ParE